MKILIIKPSSLGDIVHTLPAVEILRRSLNDLHVSWVVNDSFEHLLRPFSIADKLFLFRRSRWLNPKHWGELLNFLLQIRKEHFDIVLDFQGLFRSGFITGFSQAPRRIGFADAREGASFFYTESVSVPLEIKHALEKNVYLVKHVFNCSGDPVFPALVIDSATEYRAKQLFESCGFKSDAPILAVAPVARWQTKTWPAQFFAQVLDAVADNRPDCQIWLLGTKADSGSAAELIRLCHRCNLHDLTGKTELDTLMHTLQLTDVLLTNDSGPMHLAAALGTATVALFGPTDPVRTGPYGDGHTVFKSKCENAPCFQRKCRIAQKNCIESLDASEIARAILDKIEVKKPKVNQK